MTTRIIFLDIDGVLWGEEEGKFVPGGLSPLFESGCHTMEQHAVYMKAQKGPKYMVVFNCELNPTKINMLAEVINSAKVKVVISSSWRAFYTPREIDVLLNRASAKWELGTIIGATPIDCNPRALQVKSWLEENGYLLDHSVIDEEDPIVNNENDNFRFAIIDDCDDGFTEMFPENFIRTDGDSGLSYKDVAGKLLPILALRRAGRITRSFK